MKRLALVIALLVQAAAPQAAFAVGGHCYPATVSAMPVWDDSRLCRIDKLMGAWLERHGIAPAPGLSAHQSIAEVGSSWSRDYWGVPEFLPSTPTAMVQVIYFLDRDVSLRAPELVAFRPGLTASLEQGQKGAVKQAFCDTVSEDEEAFVMAGGRLFYSLSLRPSRLRSGDPIEVARIEFPQSVCEIR